MNYEAVYRTDPATPGLLNIGRGWRNPSELIELQVLVSESGNFWENANKLETPGAAYKRDQFQRFSTFLLSLWAKFLTILR